MSEQYTTLGSGIVGTFGDHHSTTSLSGSSSGSSLSIDPQHHAILQSLCNRATSLGSSISARITELLTTLTNFPAGVDRLSREFLEITRILWSVERGLATAEKVKDSQEWLSVHSESGGLQADDSTGLTPRMAEGLEARLRQTIRVFEALDNYLARYPGTDTKGPIAKLQGRWKRMFADKDIESFRASLEGAKRGLRASSTIFQRGVWDELGQSPLDVGLEDLTIALDNVARMKPELRSWSKAASGVYRKKGEKVASSSLRSVDERPRRASLSDEQASELSGEMSSPAFERGEPSTAPPDTATRASRSVSDTTGQFLRGSPAARDVLPPRAASDNPDAFLPNAASQQRTASWPRDLSFASTLVNAETWMEEMKSVNLGDIADDPRPRIRAEPASMPRWVAHDVEGGNAEGLKHTLAAALESRNHRVIELLLDKGVSPDGAEMRLLRQAVLNRDLESLLLLLLFGADPNLPDDDGVTALYAAVRVVYPEAVGALLKYGADPNLSTGAGGSPLDLAVAQADMDLTRILLIYGGDPNQCPPSGKVPLIESSGTTSPDGLVDLLLRYGADPNTKDNHGHTALCRAVSADRVDNAMCLLDHGADPNLPGPEHVLWYATRRPACMRLVLARGAEIGLASGVLELSTSINEPESVSQLLAAGASPDGKKDGVYTPLCAAIRDGRSDIATMLLDAGADANLPGPEVPLRECVTRHRNDLLPRLVRAGADVRRVQGIVEAAVAARNVKGLAWLLRHGADASERSAAGSSPLETAAREELPEAVSLLRSSGAGGGERVADPCGGGSCCGVG